MKKNSSGKIVTVFVVIAAVLLSSLTAIAIFFFQKEFERRKEAQVELDKSHERMILLEKKLKEVEKEAFVLGEKNKEADEKINNLLDELELDEGIRKELKTEITSLKTKLEEEQKVKDQLKQQLSSALSLQDNKYKELTVQLEQEQKTRLALEKSYEDLKAKLMGAASSVVEPQPMAIRPDINEQVPALDVELKPIVVSSKPGDGRVLTIDKDTEFVIVSLGHKAGVQVGDMMSVYRGKEYLGDVKVTRVLPEMSAADLLPPFSIRTVRKNDQVVPKE